MFCTLVIFDPLDVILVCRCVASVRLCGVVERLELQAHEGVSSRLKSVVVTTLYTLFR